MTALYAMFQCYIANKKGATAIEYGLIAAAISIVIVGAMATLGGGLTTVFGRIAGNLT